MITSVGPNPVLGTATSQNFCLNGSGFINGPGLKVRLTWPTARMDVPVNFFNPEQLCLTFTFGIAPGNWTAQVVSGDGQLSNIFFFTVAAPGPRTVKSFNGSDPGRHPRADVAFTRGGRSIHLSELAKLFPCGVILLWEPSSKQADAP